MRRLRSLRAYQIRYGFVDGMRLAFAVWRTSRAAATGGPVPVNVPGLRSPIYLRPGTTDAAVFHQWWGGVLRFGGIQNARCIIDAGGNIGVSTVYFAARFPDARVVALELEESNYSLLRANTAPFSNVLALHKGLWWRPAQLAVANPAARAWSYRAKEVLDATTADGIEAVTVKEVLEQYCGGTVDLLKIDIEGSERELFSQGVDQWIESVGAVAVELHEWCSPGCGRIVRQSLLEHGFRECADGEYRLFIRDQPHR